MLLLLLKGSFRCRKVTAAKKRKAMICIVQYLFLSPLPCAELLKQLVRQLILLLRGLMSALIKSMIYISDYKCDSTSNSQTGPNSPARPGLPAIQSQNVVLTPDGCDDYQAVKTVKTVITWGFPIYGVPGYPNSWVVYHGKSD